MTLILIPQKSGSVLPANVHQPVGKLQLFYAVAYLRNAGAGTPLKNFSSISIEI